MRFVICGGGVTGVCCAQKLRTRVAGKDDVVTLISESPTVKVRQVVVVACAFRRAGSPRAKPPYPHGV